MWETVRLGDVCQIVNGGTPKSKVPAYWDGDIDWLTPKDMGKLPSRYINNTERAITQDGLENSSAKLIPSGSVLLSCRAPIGHIGINPKPISFNQGCKGLIPNNEVIAEYLYYFLFASKKLLNDLGSGTTFKEISSKTLSHVPINLPPLAEQKRIVERLDKAFAEIDDLVSLGDAEEANGISVMAAWLAEIFSQDIKGSRNVLSLSAGGAEAPAKKGWKWKRLTEVAKLESGHTPSRKKPEYWGGEVKWVGIRDARESHGSLIHDTLQYTNELGIQNSSARILPPNTVCLSRTASVGYVFRLGVPMATSQDFINWVCGDALDPAFLQLLFMAEGEDIRRFGSGATHKTIYFSTAKSFYICIPDVEDQKKIVAEYQSIVKHQKALVASINQKNGLLKHLKASILKQELTPSELA